jgi:ankyrin repeat protein
MLLNTGSRHAQFEDVSSFLKGMEYLFDLDKPYFAAWLQLHELFDFGVDVNIKNDYDATPLLFASNHDPGVVQFLLDHGADPNIGAWNGDGTGETPLHYASESGRIEIARLLIEHGASVEVQDKAGRTPLDVASGEQHDEMIKLLLELRAK